MPVPLQAQATGGGLSGADILRVLRQNMWLFVLAAVVSGAAGFGINEYLKRYQKYYMAHGKVLVQPPRQFDPTGTVRLDEQGNDIDLKIMLQNQVQQLKNEVLLTELLMDPNSKTRQSKWLAKRATRGASFDQSAALEALQWAFGARAIEGSSIMSRSSSPVATRPPCMVFSRSASVMDTCSPWQMSEVTWWPPMRTASA